MNKEVKLVLFDGQFNTITNVQGEYNSLKTNLSSGGKYYLYVEIYNVDTMLYVVSANRLKNSAIIFNEGANVNKKMAANQGLTFKFIYNKNVSQTQYLLKINETLGEQIDVSIYYVDRRNFFLFLHDRPCRFVFGRGIFRFRRIRQPDRRFSARRGYGDAYGTVYRRAFNACFYRFEIYKP